jgi:uncharacterized protein (TIGR03437 family)
MLVNRAVVVLLLSMGLVVDSGLAQRGGYMIDTYAGSDEIGDGGAAVSATLHSVEGLAADGEGNIYVADSISHRIRRVDAVTGDITTLAGTGQAGYSGDQGPAISAQLNSPYGLAVDRDNNVYVADLGNARVRKIRTDGTIETVAGGPASPVRLRSPRNVATDAAGNLYIADFGNHRVYRLSFSGIITTLAGTGSRGYDGDGPALSRSLDAPAGLAVAPGGIVYVADSGNNRVRRIQNGIITTVVGGKPGELELSQPTGLSQDEQGALYIADSGNRRIVRRDSNGQVAAVTGSLSRPEAVRDLVFQSRLIVGGGRGVYELWESGEISLLAGVPDWKRTVDGALAAEARLDGPIGLGFDLFGRLLIVEEAGRRVRMVGASGALLTVAGGGRSENNGDGGMATAAGLQDPVAVTVDARGRTWIADYLGNNVRRVSFDGRISTAAGDGSAGFAGDGGWAAEARLNRPRGIAADGYGGVFIADSENHRVRQIDSIGRITTVAGNGRRDYAGDLGPATLASLDRPNAIASAEDGSLYIADTGNSVIRLVRPDGIISTVAGTGVAGYGGDGGPARQSALNQPAGVAIDGEGNVLIADTGNHRLRLVDREGVIRTIAGKGIAGFSGDGSLGREARLDTPSSVVVDPDGTIYVADLGNSRIRRLQKLFTAPVNGSPGCCEVVHAATYQAGPLAPGQLASIFEPSIGEDEVGDVSVTIGEVPAALLYAGPGQINVQVPYVVAGRETTRVEVRRGGNLRSSTEVAVAPAVPGLFTRESGTGEAIALNEDGSWNTSESPAVPGSIVVLFATGEGLTDPPATAGVPASSPLPRPILPVNVRIAGLPGEVLYAGAAPGFSGLMQLNIRLPRAFLPSGRLPLELYVGKAKSQDGVTIAVR